MKKMKITERIANYLYKKQLNETLAEEADMEYVYGPMAKAINRSKIGNWTCSIDNQAGVFYWDKKTGKDENELQVPATPFWEDEDGIVVDVVINDRYLSPRELKRLSLPGQKMRSNRYGHVVGIELTSNPSKDKAIYLKIMKPILSKVEKVWAKKQENTGSKTPRMMPNDVGPAKEIY